MNENEDAVDPTLDACDWSHAASESAAQAKEALKASFGINGSSDTHLQMEDEKKQQSVESNSGPRDVATRYADRQETGNSNLQQDVSMRRAHTDINASSRPWGTKVVRASQSLDQAFCKRKLDKYGFIINMDDQGNLFDDATSERIPTFAEAQRSERREQKWNGMLSSWDKKKIKRKKLLKRLRKGVPDSMRGKVWCLLANVPNKIKVEKKGYYDQLVLEATRHSFGEDENYEQDQVRELANPTTTIQHSFRATQDTIERDIHRTFPRHHLFQQNSDAEDSDDDVLSGLCDAEVSSWITKLENHESKDETRNYGNSDTTVINAALERGGQAQLRRVLRAYSLHDVEVGYCQGMNFIAATFLTFMSEEEAFWLLVATMNDPPGRMRGMFGRDMQAAHQILYVADKLILQFLPRLARHLEKESIHITMYATQWILTLYTSSFHFDLVTRVWDCFLAEGWKVVYRVMLALMTNSQPILESLSFEEILAHFRDLPEMVSGEKIMDIALKINLKRKHIAKYEKEWIANNQPR